MRKKIVLVFGTRPEAIKMVPVYRALREASDRYEVKICLTGQHRTMLDQVMEFFGIKADVDLNLMRENQKLSGLSANLLTGFTEVLEVEKPDLILVHGDTTTSSMAALAAYYQRIRIGHVEAGLRTYQKYSPFPEEINRQITGRIADFHFAPTQTAMVNLIKEGVSASNICVTGNTVIDALNVTVNIIKNDSFRYDAITKLKSKLDPDKKLILVTGHRRENFGEGFLQICKSIKYIVEHNPEVQVIYPVHLNPNVKDQVEELLGGLSNILLIPPVDYPSFVYLMTQSYLILTDSGGVQEEGPSLNKPVLVMRETSERPEAIESGAVKLVGTNADFIIESVESLLRDKETYKQMADSLNPYGDGTASKQILAFIKSNLL